MSSITAMTKSFFDARGRKGWRGCKEWCRPDATFSEQAQPLVEIRTLERYTEWMKDLLTFIPDGRYDLRSFATDEECKNVSAYAVFMGTYTGQGGPAHRQGRLSNPTMFT